MSRSESSSCATSAPKIAITASPTNFATVPPCRRAARGSSAGGRGTAAGAAARPRDPSARRVAFKAALAIRELAAAGDLEVHIGITTGEAIITLDATVQKGEHTASGESVNTAARLESAATAGRIFVDEATRRATEQSIEFDDALPVMAKGKSDPCSPTMTMPMSLPAPSSRSCRQHTTADDPLRHLKDLISMRCRPPDPLIGMRRINQKEPSRQLGMKISKSTDGQAAEGVTGGSAASSRRRSRSSMAIVWASRCRRLGRLQPSPARSYATLRTVGASSSWTHYQFGEKEPIPASSTTVGSSASGARTSRCMG